MRQRRRRQEPFERLEVRIVLAREPGDKVRSNRRVRKAFGDALDQPAVGVERVRPAHLPQHPIAGVLQRQVEVRRQPSAARGDEIDDGRRAIHRLQ